MALDVPFDAIIQAKQRAAQNKQQMMQGFGQMLANLGQTGGDILQKRAEAMKKEKQKKDLFAQLSQVPELQKLAGAMSDDPALIGQLGPVLLKPKQSAEEIPFDQALSVAEQSGNKDAANPFIETAKSQGRNYLTKQEMADMFKTITTGASAKRGNYMEGILDVNINKLTAGLIKDARDTLNPYYEKGPGKDQAQRLDSISRIEPLIAQMRSQPKGGNPQQMRELATSFTRVLAGGGTGAEAQIEALVPQTAKSKFASWQQWLLNEPTGTQQQAFIKQYADSVAREKQAITNRIDMQAQANAPTLRVLKKVDPKSYQAVIDSITKQFGSPQPTQAGVPAAQAGPYSDSGKEARYQAWKKANGQ